MSSLKIVTDSTSYIPEYLRKELDISVVSLGVNFSNESSKEEDIDNSVFYEKISKSDVLPTSSQPSPHDFYKVFEKHVQNNNSIVGIFISSDMSGTYSTAILAKKMIMEKYPDAAIEILDSRSNCMQMGFAVLAAAASAKFGNPIEQVVGAAKKIINCSRFLFVPDTLEYLKKGGRIGGAAALLGTILQIRPILTVVDGKTTVIEKVRTKTKAIQKIIDILCQDVQQKGLGEVVVHHINSEKEGIKLAQTIKEKLSINVPVYPIGPVIGLHVGPGAVGVAYYWKG